jgi:hypothetical protein
VRQRTLRLLAAASFAVATHAAELPAELRVRVDALVAAVEREPTSAATAAERARVVWDWGNALALEGEHLPINLPLVAKNLLHTDPGEQPPARFFPELDSYVRQLALRARHDRPFGSLRIEAPEASAVLSYQVLRVVWTVGDLPMAPGGLVLPARHFMATFGAWQRDDPRGDGYLTIAASRAGARFAAAEAPMFGAHGGFRGAVPVPAYRLEGAALEPGDTVTITYGDRSGGGRGMRLPEFSNDAVPLPVYVDLGGEHAGLLASLPIPTFRVVGGPVHAVHGFAPSIVAPGERFVVSVRSEDYHYNRATGEIPAYRVRVNGERFAELPGDRPIHLLEATFDREGVYRFVFESADGTVTGRANPVWVRAQPGERLYWGETHGHSGFAEGMGSVDSYFEFGRDDARLDFLTLSEHDLWMDDHEWRVLDGAVQRFSREGEFLAYPGYEWTANRGAGGHHNVFFRRPGFDRVPVQEAPQLSMLYRELHRRYRPDDVLVIPHAHQAGDWRLSDLGVERLAEIVSGHGTFEWFGRLYLEHGWRLGFVGASDDHLGHPGYAAGRGRDGNRGSISSFGGLAAVYAPAKCTDAVFDALRDRATYATSGAERIILDARLNDRRMGSELDFAESRVLEGRVIGTGAIDTIEVIRNGELVWTKRVAAATLLAGGAASDEEVTVDVQLESSSEPPVRDNPRGTRTWGGRIIMEGARVLGAELPGRVNRGLDYARVEADGGGVSFEVGTRGIRHTLRLRLSGASSATVLRVALEPSREAGKAPSHVVPLERFEAATVELPFGQLAAGSSGRVERELRARHHRDTVAAQLVPRTLQDDVTFRFEDTGRYPGDWYYVRVRQLDGALAWSSPWWLGGDAPR